MQGYFTDDELKCPCCGKVLMDKSFLRKLNLARFIAGFPFVVNSGYRCPGHNKAVGSTSTNHTSGQAADIKCIDANRRYEMVIAMIGVRMMGIGIGKTFVHCDNKHPVHTIWTY